MREKPLIGVTPFYNCDTCMTYIKPGYMEAVIEAGGLAVLLPLTRDNEILARFMDEFDGFILSGGPDVDARYYGEPNLPFTGDISPIRDYMEIFIVKKCEERNKPILGICRGIQVMNVALGGTLYQDIPAQIKDREILKHSQDAPKWYPIHDIHIDEDSVVGRVFGKKVIDVNSFHHQAVKNTAPGLVATSRAADGIIESIEHKTHKFMVGVQWHPELMWQRDRAHLKLFEEFVAKAGEK